MKKHILPLLVILLSGFITLSALGQQAPQKFNYQAVARDSDGKALAGQEVALRVAIMSEAEPDRPLYAEEHLVTTNKLGLFNIHIGGGELLEGNMETIDWGSGAHYLSVKMDAEGFGNFQQMGTSQLLSVPYALYAAKSGSAVYSEDGGSRSDPNDWTMSGNTGTDDASDFLGTTDGQDLAIRTNNTEVARFTTDGDLDLASDSRILSNGSLLLAATTDNAYVGTGTDHSTDTGTDNLFVGNTAGRDNTSGSENLFLGSRAGRGNTTGERNIYIGPKAGLNGTTASTNIMVGAQAGQSNTTGNFNTFIGRLSGFSNTTGRYNLAIGSEAGESNISSDANSFIGFKAGESTTGPYNTAIGYLAGNTNTTGQKNTYIGYGADGSATIENATAIGADATVAQSNSVVLGNDANVGIGTSSPEAKLHVVGGFKLVDGTQSDGYVLTSDANGTATWQSVASVSGTTSISDSDDDTKIQVEETSDEDIIRFDVAGNEAMVIAADGNVGIGISTLDTTLHVVGQIKYDDGNQADGYVLTSDADGNASWQTPPTDTDDQTLSLNSDTLRIDGGNWVSLSTFWNTDNQELSISGNTLSIENGNSVEISTDTLTIISDADGDTKIQVEESADEDIIRFDLAGTEHFVMDGPRLEVLNSGASVFIGDGAGANDDLSNNQNVYIGNNAGSTGTTAYACVAVGTGALVSNSTSGSNTAIGYKALYATTATGNTAVGSNSLANNTTGQYNNGVGLNTLNAQTSGANYNNAFGSEALENNSTGDNNSAFGDLAMNRNTTGGANTAMGAQALENNFTGSNNVAIGYQAGESASGSSNVFLGFNAGRSETGSDKLYIENTNSASPLIYGEFDNDLVTINGSLGIVDGTQADGYVLTSDASGNASWQATVGDDLGDHTATENIQTNGNYISNDGDDEGIYINSNGRVAIGGTTTSDLLHISGTGGIRVRAESTNGNYAGLVAKNSNRNIFIGVQGTGDPNSGEFHIYDNTAGARRMVIDAAGEVGIGVDNPSYKLHVNGQVAGTSAYVNTSDAKFKTNVEPIGAALEKLLLLEGVSYDWKTKEFPEKNFDNRHQLGFIAQDVEAIVPEAVSITAEGDYGLSYSTFIPLLVEAVKELKAENEALKAENTTYEARLQRLEELMGVGLKAQR